MIFLRGCPRLLSTALVAIALVALFYLFLQTKQFYEDHRKYLRLQSYKHYMEEISASMVQSEKEASVGIAQLESLNQALQVSVMNTSSNIPNR